MSMYPSYNYIELNTFELATKFLLTPIILVHSDAMYLADELFIIIDFKF